MAKYNQKDDGIYLPVIPLRGMVIFPDTVNPITVGRERSLEALEYATTLDSAIFLVAQKDPTIEEPGEIDLYRVGTISKIVQIMRFPNDRMKVLLEGKERAEVIKYNFKKNIITSVVSPIKTKRAPNFTKIKAYYRKVWELFKKYTNLTSSYPEEILQLIDHNEDIDKIVNIISAQLLINFQKKQSF